MHSAQAQPAALAGGICLFCGGDGAGDDKLHIFRVLAAPRQRPPYAHGVDPRVGMSADHVNAAAAREHGEVAERPSYAFDVAFQYAYAVYRDEQYPAKPRAVVQPHGVSLRRVEHSFCRLVFLITCNVIFLFADIGRQYLGLSEAEDVFAARRVGRCGELRFGERLHCGGGGHKA